jgi:hypothetical protein
LSGAEVVEQADRMLAPIDRHYGHLATMVTLAPI